MHCFANAIEQIRALADQTSIEAQAQEIAAAEAVARAQCLRAKAGEMEALADRVESLMVRS